MRRSRSGLPPAAGWTSHSRWRAGCVPFYVALYRASKLPAGQLMSGKLPLDGSNEGFDRLHGGKAVRQVIEFPA